MTDNERIKYLIEYLNARTAEYDAGHPTISDFMWDEKFHELELLEWNTGLTYPNSPTQSISFELVNQLKKVKHNHPMLSLPKSKDISVFDPTKGYIAMPKMDGLTCSLTYKGGMLVAAETRGNGEIGEDILHNAHVITNIPQFIGYEGDLVVDGEIICKLNDFVHFENQYKNPRNFAAGSIRLLDSRECANRRLSFVAWEVIEGFPEQNLLSDKLIRLGSFGFEVVPTVVVNENHPEQIPDYIVDVANLRGYPIDGVVLKIDDIEMRNKEEGTSHHLGGAVAYKFYDEEYDTILLDIDWTMGRTGELTPVAVFEPVDADGSIIERASLHNVDMLKETLEMPYRGQPIRVAKMNEIIPQIVWADMENCSNQPEDKWIKLPKVCPICGEPTELKTSANDVCTLHCGNPSCPGKLINRLDHFCGKKGLDIRGLSKATLEKLCNWGWVNSYNDLTNLVTHKDEWVKKPGFGEKSVQNILDAIAKATFQIDEAKFICAIGIPLVGSTAAKEIIKRVKTYELFRGMIDKKFRFSDWDGFGPELENAILNFDYSEADKFYAPYKDQAYMKLYDTDTGLGNDNNGIVINQTLKGMTICITGSLKTYKNRDALKSDIENHGGKVTESVSKKTTFLVNNDVTSTSSKNAAAKKLGIPIITEEELISKMNENV